MILFYRYRTVNGWFAKRFKVDVYMNDIYDMAVTRVIEYHIQWHEITERNTEYKLGCAKYISRWVNVGSEVKKYT